MPPRKRARTQLSTGTTPTVSSPLPSTPTPAAELTSAATLADAKSPTEPSDPWTPEQEIALFKALIRFKPTGIHKHFHMLCISDLLRSQGHSYLPAAGRSSLRRSKVDSRAVSSSAVTTSPNMPSTLHSDREDSNEHTRIPGIWAKLSSLYDLDVLDERENNHTISLVRSEPSSPGDMSRSHSQSNMDDDDRLEEFALPDDPDEGFSDIMWMRRFKYNTTERPPEGSESELEMPWLLARSRELSPTALQSSKASARSAAPPSSSRKKQAESIVKQASTPSTSPASRQGGVPGNAEKKQKGGPEPNTKSKTPIRATRSSGRFVKNADGDIKAGASARKPGSKR